MTYITVIQKFIRRFLSNPRKGAEARRAWRIEAAKEEISKKSGCVWKDIDGEDFVLSDADANKLMTALENPPEPNEELKALLRKPS